MSHREMHWVEKLLPGALLAQLAEPLAQDWPGDGGGGDKSVFLIQTPDQVRAHWQRFNEMLRKQYSKDVPDMEASPNDLLTFLLFPQGSLAQVLVHIPVGAALRRTDKCAWQRSDQTPSQPGRHLPK